MSTMVEQQRAFMDAANQTTDEYFNLEQYQLYQELCWEEGIELNEAFGHIVEGVSSTYHIDYEEPLENQLKEAADVLVVTLGLIISMGVDPDDLFRLVSENNMLKVTGEVVKDSTGKVIKSQASIDAKEILLADIQALLKPEED